jgi:hypothetical protein
MSYLDGEIIRHPHPFFSVIKKYSKGCLRHYASSKIAEKRA